MAEIGAVLERHSSSAVLEAAARTFLSLCGEETTGCPMARAARDSLVQRWVDQLTALLADSLEARGTDELYAKKGSPDTSATRNISIFGFLVYKILHTFASMDL